MKKIYLGMLGMGLLASASAQNFKEEIKLLPQTRMEGNSTQKPTSTIQEKGVEVWSNEFSNAADWSLTNTSSPSQNWVWTTDASVIPVAALAPAAFTTVGNGYFIIDSDGAGATATQNSDLTLATAIDLNSLSTFNNFTLKFEHSYRTFEDGREVRVSGDNGSTWSTYVLTTFGDNSEANVNTGNPSIYSINITDDVVIGGVISSQVLIQFHYEGAYGWYWAVDDVSIVETDDNEVNIVSTNFGSYGFWEVTMPYYQVPLDQITDVTFSSIIKNVGAINQTNTDLTVDINSGAATVASPAGFTSLIGGVNDTLVTAPYLPTAGTVATYNFDMLVESDNVDASPADNVASGSFETTNFIYARDMGVATGSSANDGADYEVGNVFDIFANATLYSVQMEVATTSTGNPIAYATLYSIDATTGDFIFMETTDEITITTAQITSGATVDLTLLSPVNLVAGNGYLVVVGTYAGTTDYLEIGTSGISEAQTTFLNDVSTSTWFYSTRTPMVRMNFQVPPPTVSMNNAAFSMSESDGTFDLVLDITEAPAADVTVSLSVTGGTATAADYTFTSPTTVTFPAGTMASQTVAVPVINDGIAEGAETIIFALSNVSANGAIGAGSATVTIDANMSVTEKSIEGAILGQNFPNPANGNTSINYTLTEKANVMIQVTDVAGKIINVMNEGDKVAGTYTVNVNTADLSAGTYFYTLSTEKGTVTKSMNVIK